MTRPADALATLCSPRSWPTWVRRVWLLTLPISGPLYFIFTVTLCIAIYVVFKPLLAACDFWDWMVKMWDPTP